MASVKISALPSGSPLAPEDVLIFNDTSEQTTKKVTVDNMFRVVETVTATSDNGGEELSFNLYRIAPHFGLLTGGASNYVVTNNTSANVMLKWTLSKAVTGSTSPVLFQNGLIGSGNNNPVTSPMIMIQDTSMWLYCDATENQRAGALIPANSQASMSMRFYCFVWFGADF